MGSPEQKTIDQLGSPQIPHQTLAVLSLPGVEQYVSTDPTETGGDIDEHLDRMVAEVNKQLSAESEIAYITHALGWSVEHSESFFSHPDRRPFQSEISFSTDPVDRHNQFVTIGKYLRYKHEDSKNQSDEEKTRKLRENLLIFYNVSLNSLFYPLVMDHEDRVNGINPQDRRKGTIHPTDEIVNLMNEESSRIANEFDEDPDTLDQKVMAATEDGNFSTIRLFLNYHKGEPVLRRALEAIFEIRLKNIDLGADTLQLLWKAEAYRMDLGIDLDLLYENEGLPDGEIIASRIHEYLNRNDGIERMQERLSNEAPVLAARADQTKQAISYWDIKEAHAQYHNFSDTSDSAEQLKARTTRVFTRLSELLPLAFVEMPTSYFDAPVGLGTDPRSVNVSYRNTENQLVGMSFINPHDSDTENKFAQLAGHELTHKLHHLLLVSAENNGYLEPESENAVSASIKEQFAFLVEKQINDIWDEENKRDSRQAADESTTQKKSGGLNRAMEYRRQGVFALSQMEVRRAMEERWKMGKRDDLSKGEAITLMEHFNPQITAWYQEGVPIRFPHEWASNWRTNNVNILEPLDGLWYIRPVVANPPESSSETSEKDSTKSQDEKPVEMGDAFKQRFGDRWLHDKDARSVLLALLAETGRNFDFDTYGTFVLEADIEKVKERLNSFGVPESLI